MRNGFEDEINSFHENPHTQLMTEVPDRVRKCVNTLRRILVNNPLPSQGCPHLWVKQPEKQEWFALIDPITIGAESHNELPLLDNFLSGRHCKIEPIGEDWKLIDQNSTNGTYVNGNQVKEYTLNDGDIIQIGKCSLIFVTPEH